MSILYLYAILLLLLMLACWLLTVVGMPGNWMMVAATAVYAWLVPEDAAASLGWGVVLLAALLAGFGELLEAIAGALGVAKAGGSRRGAVLALAGSLAGGLVGMVVGLPIPVVGSLVAAVLFAGAGALVGAMLGEQWKGRDLDESWEVGKGAFWGRLLGTLGKVLVGSIIIVIVALALIF